MESSPSTTPQAESARTHERECLPEFEWERQVREIVADMRDLGFDLVEMDSQYPPRTNLVDATVFLLECVKKTDSLSVGYDPYFGFRALTEPLRSMDVELKRETFEKGMTTVVYREPEHMQAVDTLNEMLQPPADFRQDRAMWLVLLATVHQLEPGFDLHSNRLDLNHADSTRTPLWDLVKRTAIHRDPQDFVDTAYGRVIRKNLGSEYRRSDYSDPRYAIATAQAVRKCPTDGDLDLWIGRVTRKAAYERTISRPE